MLDGNRPGRAGGNAIFPGRSRGQLLTCSQEQGGEGSQAPCTQLLLVPTIQQGDRTNKAATMLCQTLLLHKEH